MRKASFVGAVAIATSLLLATPAIALGNPESFNGFAVESPLTTLNASDNGWQYIPDGGPAGVRDVAIVDVGVTDDDVIGNALRMSNAVTDSSFGNWLYSQKITPVTEDADGNSFIAEFDIQSATGLPQPGLQISVSPQSGIVNGDGARMSFLKFVDDGLAGGGIDVFFTDANNDGSFDANLQEIASNLSRTESHDVKIVLDLYTGANNDVVQVYIDSNVPRIPMTGGDFEGFFAPVDNPDTANKVKAGQSVPMKWKLGALEPATTWEDYYRFDDESNAAPVQDPNTPGTEMLPTPWGSRPVDSLIFQARDSGGAAPDTQDEGFLFDNVNLSTGATGTLPQGGAAGDASVYTAPIFSWRTVPCDLSAEIDPLETADVPGASHLTYDAATGVWHYNWQTTKSMTGACVKLTLNINGEYALFKIVK